MVAGEEAYLDEYVKNIKPGEDVLLEYTSREPAHLLFHHLMECLMEHDYPFLIVDELDQLHVFRAQLKLSGVDTSWIERARVIKIGGMLQTGNVIGRVDMSKDFPIRKKHYEEALKKFGSGYAVRIVLGFDKVLAMHEEDRKDLEALFGNMIRPYLGDESRTTIYLINTDLLNEKTLREFMEHASRVFRAEMKEGTLILRVLKSPELSEYGREIRVKIGEV